MGREGGREGGRERGSVGSSGLSPGGHVLVGPGVSCLHELAFSKVSLSPADWPMSLASLRILLLLAQALSTSTCLHLI